MSDIPAQSDTTSCEGKETNPSLSNSAFVSTEESAENDLSALPKRVIKPPETYAPSDYNPRFQHFKRSNHRGQSPYSGVVTRSHTRVETIPISVPQYNIPRKEVLESLLDIGFH